MSHIHGVLKGIEAPVFVNGKGGASSLLEIMKQVSQVLNYFETSLAKFDEAAQMKQSEAAQASVKVAQHLMDKAEKTLKKIEKEHHQQDHRSFWGKVFKVVAVVAVVVGVVAFLAMGQPEIALAVAGAAGISGLDKMAEKGISKMLQAMGVPPNIANILADVLLTAVIVLGTFGYGTAAGIEASAEVATEEAAEESTESLGQKAGGLLEKIKSFVGPRGGLTIVNGATTWGSLNTVQNIVEVLPVGGKKKRDALIALEVIEVVTTVIAALVGGGGVSTAATGETVATEASTLKNAMTKVEQFLNQYPSLPMALQGGMSGIGGLGSNLVQLLNGLDQLQMAHEMKHLATYKAGQLLANDAMEIADRGVTHSTKSFQTDIQIVDAMLESADQLTDVMGDTAQTLTV